METPMETPLQQHVGPNWRRETLLKHEDEVDGNSSSLSIMYVRGITMAMLGAIRALDGEVGDIAEGASYFTTPSYTIQGMASLPESQPDLYTELRTSDAAKAVGLNIDTLVQQCRLIHLLSQEIRSSEEME